MLVVPVVALKGDYVAPRRQGHGQGIPGLFLNFRHEAAGSAIDKQSPLDTWIEDNSRIENGEVRQHQATGSRELEVKRCMLRSGKGVGGTRKCFLSCVEVDLVQGDRAVIAQIRGAS